MDKEFGLGLVGAGAFGIYCLKAFASLKNVTPVAAARARKPQARKTLEDMGVAVLDDYRDVIEHPDVDVVHVATPPSSHPELVLAALAAGKHVLCEKPLALRTSDAVRMAAAAQTADRFCVANFIMRHNPAAAAVRQVLRTGALGRPLAVHLTNLGSDSGLAPDHWFWDKSLSGGIFIEHSVHFFDLYRWWCGDAEVLAGWAARRENGGMEDRVGAVARAHDGTLLTQHHGFDQIPALDRTDHRIVCELGDVRVDGWVPLSVTIDAAVNDEGATRLAAGFDGAQVETVETFAPGVDGMRGRGVERFVTRRIRLRWSDPRDKETLYAQCIRDLLADQLAWAADRSHARRVEESNGVEALRLGEAAARMAAGGPPG